MNRLRGYVRSYIMAAQVLVVGTAVTLALGCGLVWLVSTSWGGWLAIGVTVAGAIHLLATTAFPPEQQ